MVIFNGSNATSHALGLVASKFPTPSQSGFEELIRLFETAALELLPRCEFLSSKARSGIEKLQGALTGTMKTPKKNASKASGVQLSKQTLCA